MFAGPLIAVAAEPEEKPAATTADEGAVDDVISLAAYNVKADRVEDFGLRVDSAPYPRASSRPGVATLLFTKFAPEIIAIVPNTAAAKAGLQPGERILKSEGQSTVAVRFRWGNRVRGKKRRRKNGRRSPRAKRMSPGRSKSKPRRQRRSAP